MISGGIELFTLDFPNRCLCQSETSDVDRLSLATREFMLFSGLCVVFPKFSVFVVFFLIQIDRSVLKLAVSTTETA